MIVVPTLVGELITLRPFDVADVECVIEASSDVAIPMSTTVPATPDPVEAAAFIERQWSRSTSGEGYSFAIVDNATGRAVGQIGLWLHPIRFGRASIGYWMLASH